MFSHLALSALSLALHHQRTAYAASPAEWRSRSIYQLLTDRFARPDGSTTATCDTASGKYCGGTWTGIIDRLDYIQGMGFDADLYDVNSHYGSKDDLKALSQALHARGMYLMVDIVVNHNGWNGPPDSVDYSKFNPFNKKEYYNTPYCEIDYNDLGDTAQLTECWVGGSQVPLPDLKTSDQRVRDGYAQWIQSLTSNYSIDGLRLDTVLQVEKGFWSSFRSAVNDMYMVGEIFQQGANLVCDYQNYISGVFNYPVYFPLINAFKSTSGSMTNLAQKIGETRDACNDISLLGSFSENHDNPRFPTQNEDMAQASNVITYTLVADGIPILYQGQEQHYDSRGGVNDPYNREALWFSGYNTEAELYKLVTNLNKARKNAIRNDPSFVTTPANVVYTDTTTIAVKKGKLLTVLSNKGSSGDSYTQAIRSYYQSGSSVTELLSCTKLTSDSDSNINVPMSGGMPRVYYPTADIGTLCGGATSGSTGSSSDSPSEGSSDTPVEGSSDTPVEGSSDTPTEGSSDTPVEESSDTPSEGSTDTPSGGSTDTPSEGSTDTPSSTPDTPVLEAPEPSSNSTSTLSGSTGAVSVSADGSVTAGPVSVSSDGSVSTGDVTVSSDGSVSAGAVSVSADGTVSFGRRSRPNRLARPARPNRAFRNRAARPSRARRSKPARWVA
ncbi:hypothetical protein Q7P35_004979 [Cladosporium inversicolor]